MNSLPERGTLPALDGRAIPYVFERSGIENAAGAFILVHGLGMNKDEYLGFYETLSRGLTEAGFDVLRIDLPAHGESDAALDDFSLVNCIADAITAGSFLLRKSSARSLRVFGTSFGAGPAIAMASFFCDTLDSVTLLAPAISYQELYISPTYPARRAKYARFYREALLDDRSVSTEGRATLTWRNAIEFAMVDLTYHLGRIADRTAILHGKADSIVPHELSRELVRRCPQIDLTLVDGMDHGFMDCDDDDGIGVASQRNLQTILEKSIR